MSKSNSISSDKHINSSSTSISLGFKPKQPSKTDSTSTALNNSIGKSIKLDNIGVPEKNEVSRPNSKHLSKTEQQILALKQSQPHKQQHTKQEIRSNFAQGQLNCVNSLNVSTSLSYSSNTSTYKGQQDTHDDKDTDKHNNKHQKTTHNQSRFAAAVDERKSDTRNNVKVNHSKLLHARNPKRTISQVIQNLNNSNNSIGRLEQDTPRSKHFRTMSNSATPMHSPSHQNQQNQQQLTEKSPRKLFKPQITQKTHGVVLTSLLEVRGAFDGSKSVLANHISMNARREHTPKAVAIMMSSTNQQRRKSTPKFGFGYSKFPKPDESFTVIDIVPNNGSSTSLPINPKESVYDIVFGKSSRHRTSQCLDSYPTVDVFNERPSIYANIPTFREQSKRKSLRNDKTDVDPQFGVVNEESDNDNNTGRNDNDNDDNINSTSTSHPESSPHPEKRHDRKSGLSSFMRKSKRYLFGLFHHSEGNQKPNETTEENNSNQVSHNSIHNEAPIDKQQIDYYYQNNRVRASDLRLPPLVECETDILHLKVPETKEGHDPDAMIPNTPMSALSLEVKTRAHTPRIKTPRPNTPKPKSKTKEKNKKNKPAKKNKNNFDLSYAGSDNDDDDNMSISVRSDYSLDLRVYEKMKRNRLMNADSLQNAIHTKSVYNSNIGASVENPREISQEQYENLTNSPSIVTHPRRNPGKSDVVDHCGVKDKQRNSTDSSSLYNSNNNNNNNNADNCEFDIDELSIANTNEIDNNNNAHQPHSYKQPPKPHDDLDFSDEVISTSSSSYTCHNLRSSACYNKFERIFKTDSTIVRATYIILLICIALPILTVLSNASGYFIKPSESAIMVGETTRNTADKDRLNFHSSSNTRLGGVTTPSSIETTPMTTTTNHTTSDDINTLLDSDLSNESSVVDSLMLMSGRTDLSPLGVDSGHTSTHKPETGSESHEISLPRIQVYPSNGYTIMNTRDSESRKNTMAYQGSQTKENRNIIPESQEYNLLHGHTTDNNLVINSSSNDHVVMVSNSEAALYNSVNNRVNNKYLTMILNTHTNLTHMESVNSGDDSNIKTNKYTTFATIVVD